MKNKKDIYNIYKSTPEACLNYWKNPPESNHPSRYRSVKHVNRSKFLCKFFIKNNISITSKILELGCSCGRNLNQLSLNGFSNLYGFDINKEAIELQKEYYSNLKVKTKVGSLEKLLVKEKNIYDVVFTMAVLHHIHNNNIWIFEHIARITKRYLCIIEYDKDPRRNYKKIFESYGLNEIDYITNDNMIAIKSYAARLFEKTKKIKSKTKNIESVIVERKDIESEDIESENTMMESSFDGKSFYDINNDES